MIACLIAVGKVSIRVLNRLRHNKDVKNGIYLLLLYQQVFHIGSRVNALAHKEAYYHAGSVLSDKMSCNQRVGC